MIAEMCRRRCHVAGQTGFARAAALGRRMTDAAALAHLDAAVSVFYSGDQARIAEADAALGAVRASCWHAGPWRLLAAAAGAPLSTPSILWCAALVEGWVRRRWRMIADTERAQCRAAIVGLVCAHGGSNADGAAPDRHVSERLQQATDAARPPPPSQSPLPS